MKITEIEKNTDLFYQELNSKCDPEVLLKIAKKGIFLYTSLYKNKRIKNHNYTIDISILARQYFMINTKQQYNHFIKILKNNFEEYNLFSFYTSRKKWCDLIIINKRFIELLKDEKDPFVVNLFCSRDSNLVLRYLEKHNVISHNTFALMNDSKLLDTKFEFLNFFYFDEENDIYNNYLVFYFNNYAHIINEVSSIGYDVVMLDYCANLAQNFNILIPTDFCRCHQFPLNFPLKMLKDFSKKIYTPNKCIFKHPNNYLEDLVNATVTENYLLKSIKNPEELLHHLGITNELKRYDIDIGLIDQSQNKIDNKDGVDHSVYYGDNFKLREKRNNIFKKKEEKIRFAKHVLKDSDKINLLLQDPNYIFTLNLNYKKEVLLIRICYIISLIHNNYNYFIINYFISFLVIKGYSIYFYDSKIIFQMYDEDDSDRVHPIIRNLKEVPNDTFNNYLCFKNIDGIEINKKHSYQ